jgi:3-oxoadipate CoA-transferase beta subunit
MSAGLSPDAIAARAAEDLPDGAYVNLGIGMPMRVVEHLPAGRECIMHSENGLLGMGPAPAPGAAELEAARRRNAPSGRTVAERRAARFERLLRWPD